MNKLLFLIAAAILTASCGSDKGFELRGTINGFPGGKIYLQQRVDKAYVSIDSVETSDDGTFLFTGAVSIPDVYYISVPGKRGSTMLFLENSKVDVLVHADSLFNPTISGSSVQDEYYEFQAGIDAIYDKLNNLYAEYKQAEQDGNTAVAEELRGQMDAVYETVGELQMNFLDENPSSFLSPFVVQSLHYSKEADEIEELLSKLDPVLDETTVIQSIKRRVEVLKSVAIGKLAPDFTQADPEGNPVKLSSLRGNYLLIDFWASWCGPCRRENPNVVAAYQKYHEKGFDILGVSLDNSKERWLEAIQVDKLTWTHVSDLKYWSNEAAALYGISSIPSNLLLDPDGNIIAKNLREEDLHTELEKLLAP